MNEVEWRALICQYLNGSLKEIELYNIAELKKCHVCGYTEFEEYMFENEDGVYCETCWESR